MTCDIILCGVGGQGILSVAAVIAQAAMDSGLRVRQGAGKPGSLLHAAADL